MWEFQLQHQSFYNEYSGLISFMIDWLDLLASPRGSQESSPTPQFKSINFPQVEGDFDHHMIGILWVQPRTLNLL